MTVKTPSRPRYVTDGGLETDLIFHHGFDLPDFAAFPLLDDPAGRTALITYFDGYAEIAADHGVGLLLESPTWRANPDWGQRLGYDAVDLDRFNRAAIDLLAERRDHHAGTIADIAIIGMIGPRGDGYVPGDRVDPSSAADYREPQLRSFAAAGADRAGAYTLADIGEAIGTVQAARSVGIPISISFTVETDGRLPDGISIADAIHAVDQVAPPDSYLINCAHPSHILRGLPGDNRIERIVGIRANASTQSHAELDEAEELDEGDIPTLVADQARLSEMLPSLQILGGCCGTDARHVAALWADVKPGRW